MKKEYRIKLDGTINELSRFLERDFSSKFKYLSEKEDRQLFFLARILTQLKQVSDDMNNEEQKVIQFPALTKTT